MHVQRLLNMSRGLYYDRNFKQNIWEKRRKNGDLIDKLTIWCQRIFFLKYIIRSPSGLDPGLQTKIPSDMSHIYCSSACIQNFGKILTIDFKLVIP